MRHYVLVNRDTPFVNKGTAMVVQNPDFSGDWQSRYFGENADWHRVQAFSIDGVSPCTPDGPSLFYNEELVSRDGMSYLLFVEPDTPPELVRQAKHYIRMQHDVVQLITFRITAFVDMPVLEVCCGG